VTADRGYGRAWVETGLHQQGVRTVAIQGRAAPERAAASSSTA
jgi:hypothetical protein